MTLNIDAIQRVLCERLCEEVQLTRRQDGALMLRTHFEFPDGDNFHIYISEHGPGGLRISDRGHTLMQISYDHEIDSFLKGTRGQLLEQAIAESGLEWDGGEFYIYTSIGGLPGADF